jgi:integrase
MGLYRRKDSKIWWMSFSASGRQYQRSTRTDDKKIAQRIYDSVKGKVALNQWIPEERQQEEREERTFRDLAQSYLDWCKGRQRSYEVKKYIINLLLRTYEHYMLDDFDNQVMEQLQTDYINAGHKVAYINKITAVIKHMFSKAYDWEMITEDALRKIRKAKPLTGEVKRLRFLSREEMHALIDVCEPYLKPIVITALNTGMRKSEILNLRWANVDLRHGFILLEKTKNGERREIPINDTLRAVFQTITRRLDIPHVFYNPATGKPYTKDLKRSFQTALKKAEIKRCTKCDFQKVSDKNQSAEVCPRCGSEVAIFKGISDFHFHDLRHTFASHLVMVGVDLATVKELLGHKDIKMTLRYAHLAPAHKVEAVQKYEQFLNEKQPTEKADYYDFMTVASPLQGRVDVTY